MWLDRVFLSDSTIILSRSKLKHQHTDVVLTAVHLRILHQGSGHGVGVFYCPAQLDSLLVLADIPQPVRSYYQHLRSRSYLKLFNIGHIGHSFTLQL